MNAMGACVYGGRLRDAEKSVLELLDIHYSEVLVNLGSIIDDGACSM